MSRFLNDMDCPPPYGSFHYIPKGKANIRANEIINADGRTFRNPIGVAYSATPLENPIIAETVLGVLEFVPIPSLDDEVQGELPLPSDSSVTLRHECLASLH